MSSGRKLCRSGRIRTLTAKRERYREWFESCTEKERQILHRAIELQYQFFSDMTLEDYEEELVRYEAEIDGQWVPCTRDLYKPGALYIGGSWRFMVVKDLDCPGCCDRRERLIKIHESERDNEIVLLHELIHAHETMLTEAAEIYRQWLTIELYDRLRPQIPHLKELLTFDAHHVVAEESRWVHGPLFLLKSLDLDLRLGLPLGTVYAYGRETSFRHFMERKLEAAKAEGQ